MPALDGLAAAMIRPDAAGWNAARGEFVLPYESVRTSADPAAALLEFLQTTYDAAANLGRWDRALLEEPVRCDCDPLPSRMESRGHLRRARTKVRAAIDEAVEHPGQSPFDDHCDRVPVPCPFTR